MFSFTMHLRPTVIAILSFMFGVEHLSAQVHTMLEPSITTCNGSIHDSGGPGFNYADNESYTTVICPDQPDGIVYLSFTTFSLNEAGSPDDELTIYDGNSTAALTLGTYTGEELLGIVANATIFNTSGCLTLVFTSNGSGTGNFAASISCSEPCEEPTAGLPPAFNDPIPICRGDTLMLDGSYAYAAPGRNLLSWSWTVNGQSTVTSTQAMDSLAFPDPGVFQLNLVVTDDVGCTSTPSDPVSVLVSGPSTFAGTIAPEAVCIDGEATLVGNAVPPTLVQWTLSSTFFGNGIALPDAVGQPFQSIASITNAPAGAVLTDASDLGDICIDLEHSFMGDLVVQLECPNGQSVVLHQQGGGGTFLGDANDLGPPGPGTCWTYCFNADPDHATWAESAINGSSPNLIQASEGTALLPGSYTSVEPLTNLIGCPLNGDWTLTIVDLWAVDDGYLCSWNLGFYPAQDTVGVDVSPTISLEEPDSAYWSGVGLVNTSGPTAVVQITTPGEHEFVFTVIDSYGCTSDTTVTINCLIYPSVDAGSDVELCQDPVALNGQVDQGPPVITMWSPAIGLDDPADPQTTVAPPAYGWYALTAMLPGGECPASDSIWVGPSAGTTLLDWNETTMTLCSDVPGLNFYDWYLQGEFFTSTSTNCLVGAPYGNWSVVGDDGTGCVLISPPLVTCPELSITQMGATVNATPGLGIYNWTFNGSPIIGESDAEVPFLGPGIYVVSLSLSGCDINAMLDIALLVESALPGGLGLSIVPNPNTGSARLIFNEEAATYVEVLDVAGRILWHVEITAAVASLDISVKLPAGAYTVRAITSAGLRTARMIVESPE